MGSKIQITPVAIPQLAQALLGERKRQRLTRQQAAAVSGVSPSFIRDAESNPGRCSLERLAQYALGLGLVMEIGGWPVEASGQGE